jgi:hypothetical protein
MRHVDLRLKAYRARAGTFEEILFPADGVLFLPPTERQFYAMSSECCVIPVLAMPNDGVGVSPIPHGGDCGYDSQKCDDNYE